MKKLFLLFTFVFLVLGLVACEEEVVTPIPSEPTPTPVETVDTTAPTISGTDNVIILVGDTFNALTGVTATDDIDGTITNISVSGTVNTAVAGTYTITYSVTDAAGNVTTATRTVTVSAVAYPTGTFNYRFADTDLRHDFFAAAENWLMQNMYGGVPVFANSAFQLFSARLQLPIQQSIPVMGFGIAFGTMSQDDFAAFGGTPGRYTYRAALAQNPTTFNQWIYDDSTSSDVISLFLDSLYSYKFNATKTGYVLNPSMAASDPEPVNATLTDTGVTVAKKWTVDLRTDLKWKFNPLTDATGLSTDIKAADFINTYKLALDNGWFRAISGGGDFFASTQAIKGARAYYDAKDTATPLAWSTVGLKAIGDYQLEFEFVDDINEWGIKYWLSSFVTTPIHLGLYARVGNRYGTSPTTTAYTGIYYLDTYEPDRRLTFVKNDLFHAKAEYSYTHYSMEVIEDAEIRFEEFLAGNLEAGAVPTARFDQFKNSPLLKRVPGATTFRLMINGLETVAKQQAQFEGSTYIPEPILANQFFKNAMFFAIDRKVLAEDVLKTSQTQMYYFTDAYLVDPEMGIPFRQTAQGQTVGANLSPATNGFNAALAKDLYIDALDQLVAAGTYPVGTAAAPTEITISLYIFSGSAAQTLFGNYIKSQFETIFKDDVRFINVKVSVEPKPFPSIYYDYMMTGDFDLAIGGISGSTLDAAGFLDVFASDNRGGFTLNWGIDTSKAEIDVTYRKPGTTVDVTEKWSFDAIQAVLTGTVYVKDGVESTPPAE